MRRSLEDLEYSMTQNTLRSVKWAGSIQVTVPMQYNTLSPICCTASHDAGMGSTVDVDSPDCAGIAMQAEMVGSNVDVKAELTAR